MKEKQTITVQAVKEKFEKLYDEWIDDSDSELPKIQTDPGGFCNAVLRMFDTFTDALPSEEELRDSISRIIGNQMTYYSILNDEYQSKVNRILKLFYMKGETK